MPATGMTMVIVTEVGFNIVEEDGIKGGDNEGVEVIENGSKESGSELGDKLERDDVDPVDVDGETNGEESLASLLAGCQLSLPD